jgi:hypothetical protein
MANLSTKTGLTPVQTRVTFSALNAATTVQNFAAYDAQELTGFVYVTTTTQTLRASVKVMVVKNGAGTYEVASADVAGDQASSGATAVPIVSFSMSGTNLQATLSSAITGTYTSGAGYIQYSLNAPALGGRFPLTVNAAQVQGNVSGAVTTGYIGEKVESIGSNAINQTGALSSSLVFNTAGAPSLVVSAGTWLIQAYTGVSNGTTSDDFYLALYDSTAAAAFGGGTNGTSITTDYRPASASGVLSFSGADRTIRIYANRNGASTIKLGTTGAGTRCGYMVAVRIA